MVLAAYMGDQTDFDAMFHFIKAHPSGIGKNLLAWKQTLENGVMRDVSGADSATDGDLDIAFALMLADRQWGSGGSINYQAQALLVLGDLMTHCVNPSDGSLLLGDWAGGTSTTHSRSSDFMVDHLLAFAAFDTARSAKWQRVYDRVSATVNHQFAHGSAETGLMADFYVKSGPDFVPVSGKYLESPHDGDFFYNSCRTPWRLGMAYILTGRAEIRDSQIKTAGWIASKTDNQPSAIKAGYFVKNGINGSAITDDSDLPFTAPFAVNAMLGGNQVWLDRLWTSITGGDFGTKTSYYGDAIRLHVLLVVSGNCWLPTGDR
jgi:endo-1,4-beta-D-glucanase Y